MLIRIMEGKEVGTLSKRDARLSQHSWCLCRKTKMLFWNNAG